MSRQASRHLALAACGGLTALCFSSPVSAQDGQSSSTSGRAQATVVRALRATPLADLSFGALVVGPAGDGEVTVSPDGSATNYSGSVRPSCGGASACAPHAAIFAVEGAAGRTYHITLPASVSARGNRTGATLPVTALVARSRNYPAANNGGQLDANGNDRFEIGGTLMVPAGTQPDIFRANLPVTVSYD